MRGDQKEKITNSETGTCEYEYGKYGYDFKDSVKWKSNLWFEFTVSHSVCPWNGYFLNLGSLSSFMLIGLCTSKKFRPILFLLVAKSPEWRQDFTTLKRDWNPPLRMSSTSFLLYFPWSNLANDLNQLKSIPRRIDLLSLVACGSLLVP